MTRMIQLVEEMGAKIAHIKDTEQELVRALGKALNRVDQRLLQNVREITSEHGARRGAMLHELQCLATRIGSFPTSHRSMSGFERVEPAVSPIEAANGPAANSIPAVDGLDAANGDETFLQCGDWRQAVSNIQDEPDRYFKVRAGRLY
jgi:hypothetical protein